MVLFHNIQLNITFRISNINQTHGKFLKKELTAYAVPLKVRL